MKRVSIFSIYMFGIILITFSIGAYLIDSKKIESLDYLYRAYKYEQLARQLPETDYKVKRLRAMADALRDGRLEYNFETGPLPSAN